MSWWLAGTSMVATTFAADTPLAVTGLVASYGVAGNWLWWNMLLSNMLTVFFFARLWRRAGVVTDVELTELRYGGKPAAFLRGFRALYLGLPINCIILGWVNLAMVKILMMIFPDLTFPAVGIADPKIAALCIVFVIMVDPAVFPPALAGLMVAAFAAAYMSTIATNLNWGASYLVNDVYRRFLAKDQTDRHYVRIAQLATVVLMVASSVVTYYQDTISGAWKFLMAVGAGTGSVCILRWFWWRINAWSEVSAMTASFVVSMGLQFIGKFDSNDPRQFAWTVLITVAVSTVTWLMVTWLTPAEDNSTLLAFYRRVKPSPTLWGPIAREASEVRPRRDGWSNAFDWLAGCTMIYLTLFGIGKIIFGHWQLGLVFLVGAAAAGCFVYWDSNRRGWKVLEDGPSNNQPYID